MSFRRAALSHCLGAELQVSASDNARVAAWHGRETTLAIKTMASRLNPGSSKPEVVPCTGNWTAWSRQLGPSNTKAMTDLNPKEKPSYGLTPLLKTARYYLVNFLCNFRHTPFVLAEAVMLGGALRFFPSEVWNGIQLLNLASQSNGDFAEVVKAALGLIQRNDARRFTRVKREIRAIVQMPVADIDSFGSYSRLTRISTIDLRSFPLAEKRNLALVLLAGVFIHHATQGHLSRKKVPRTKRTLRRIQVACWKEEARFELKLGFDFRQFMPSDENVRDPVFLERFRSMYERIHEER